MRQAKEIKLHLCKYNQNKEKQDFKLRKDIHMEKLEMLEDLLDGANQSRS